MRNWSWHRFCYGAIGAMAPEVVRIYKTFDLRLANSSLFFVGVSIVFLLLGGVFAVAWEDDHAVKCLYVGATFPIWLSGWAHMFGT